ncbi:glycine/betaine ABC transporter substrate-binding protein [Leucobacter sp. OLJS4]|uniref:glycine betaine ABC transporter substrate-binding protein n=1 Tax=unclassified Leucobacter TaxID=2621730 RepID=UPI000C18989E|nr:MULTISPECIES: glycine betaine ABC transporter substrate-binding protein [unclassified Leucobacter]PIJ50362.1 glycine/betaine ABC transporter substrate-binding protein [Leucobacter sp. OLES1]PII82516.1 glycine/betaine ABC transporter substrate-binding protein [Leucobacter sp. OLCALW19]PII87301.1 glycine/betaine ABC transporter substrate-binding protein [Leucobacter sp. OLTLW20]PII94643.1 glycine/betaine ABC transporter substrate-binding protein [Leucobacter sp. OLAS13]PII97839.1 glycine/beta
MHTRRIGFAAAALLAAGALALTGCSSSSGGSGGGDQELAGLTGEIGSKDFSEQYILAHITTELLNAHGADVKANTKLVGSANVRQALENDQFLGYWEYTGTSWITYNGNTSPVKGVDEQFTAVKEADAKKGIAWLKPAPFNNTYAFAIRSSEAEKLGVKTLSDVAKLPQADQTFCIESEFSTRDDGWPGLTKAYGFDAPASNVKMLDTGVIYTATQKGTDCNFGEVFQTDGRIPALKLTVMEDDKQFFPSYQGGFTLKESTLKKYPKIADVLGQVSPKLTTEVMQKLNAKVDVDGEDPQDVAIEWLEDEGLIK